MEIILIPGMWLNGSAWDAVVPTLEKAGHRANALTLPGMESKAADRSTVTLQDLVDAVVAAIDSADGQVAVVGHSMGGALAHAAADARIDRVARVVYVDSWPTGDGGHLNSGLPVENGEVPLPDWSLFDDEDLVDLSDELRAEFRERAIPWPGLISRDPVHLTDERRYDVPSTLIACEFTSAQLREWTAAGESNLRELGKLRAVEYVDLPTGHWPMFTKPAELGEAIVRAVS
ncbi:alpha/beta fold hydrolase [Flindersiella endophytica]